MRSPPKPSQAKKRMKPNTSTRERRRLDACCEKRSMGSSVMRVRSAFPSPTARRELLRRPVHRQVDLRNRAFGDIGDLPELDRRRTGHPSDEIGGELLLPGVVLRGRVVIELPRERDLVLGGGQLLLQLRHVPGRLEIRVCLD